MVPEDGGVPYPVDAPPMVEVLFAALFLKTENAPEIGIDHLLAGWTRLSGSRLQFSQQSDPIRPSRTRTEIFLLKPRRQLMPPVLLPVAILST
jgi:hypothetical protein